MGSAIDRFCGGRLDEFDVDQVLFQYLRAAKELWKFCNLGDTELATSIVREQPTIDWWERRPQGVRAGISTARVLLGRTFELTVQTCAAAVSGSSFGHFLKGTWSAG